jgi:hypothetical protein
LCTLLFRLSSLSRAGWRRDLASTTTKAVAPGPASAVQCVYMPADIWPSLADELALAGELFGHDGAAMVSSWLDVETSRVGDDDFAAQFYNHVSLPGVSPSDYSHRVIRTSRGGLLGGIRFRGRDVNRPFVEIIAHGFEDLQRLSSCVRDEWSMFRPECLRVCVLPGRISEPNTLLDMSIYVARYRDMLPCDPVVQLRPCPDAEDAIDMVSRRYEHLAVNDPALARNVFPAAPDDLRRWHHDGRLQAITVNGVSVGVLAVAPGAVRWIEGDEIQEEVIDPLYGGCGYAALAQAAWACTADDPDRLLIGTIDGSNTASRKTAGRARRRRVLDRVFIPVQRA